MFAGIIPGIIQTLWTILQFFSAAETVSTAISGGYDFLVDAELLEPQENVKSYLSKLKCACKLSSYLKTSLTMLKDMNKDQSRKVEAALVSLEYLDLILKQHRDGGGLDLRQKPHVQKVEEIYSDLKAALNFIKLKVSLNKSSSIKQWVTAPQTKQQLKDIEAKIKDAVQKSIELTTILTSVAVGKLHALQHFNAYGTWLVTSNTTKPPYPPQLHIEELGNKFILTWSTNDEDISFFELCYDEDEHSSMPLNGNMHKIEIGFPLVVPGRIYSMKIRGINEGGEGKWSDLVVGQFTKPSPRKPDPPKIHMASTSRVMLTVVPPQPSHETESPVTEWNVQYIVDGLDKEWTLENYKVKPSEENHNLDVKNVVLNQKYYFRVQAVNAEGESDFSQPVCFKTELKIKLSEIDFISASKVKLTIPSPKQLPPVTEWELQCTHEPPKPITYTDESEDEIQTFVLEDLLPNHNYSIRVQAMLLGGWTVISPVVSFEIPYVEVPSFATLLSQLTLALSAMLTPLSLYYAIPLLFSYQDYVTSSVYYIITCILFYVTLIVFHRPNYVL